MRRLGLMAIGLLLWCGCRPVAPAGLPRDPGEALALLSSADRPRSFSMTGRLRTQLSGVTLDMGLRLIRDTDGSARLDLELPFGGTAMTLVVARDGAVLCTTAVDGLAYFSEDGDQLARGLLGEWAHASVLVDVLTGRLPATIRGEARWERHDSKSLLALPLPDARRALVETERRPTRLHEILLLGADDATVATATWDSWNEVNGYWFPGEIALRLPGKIGEIDVEIREVLVEPDLDPGQFDISPPPGCRPLGDLLGSR